MSGRRNIVRDPRVRGGAPTLEGSHVTVGDLLAELRRGVALKDLPLVFPILGPEDIRAALDHAASLLGARSGSRPALSIVVAVHAMPEQASRTLLSLSTRYQQGVRSRDYEVIVVENESSRLLGERRATQHGDNFRYVLRAEAAQSPVHAMNLGVELATADTVALCIDGARLASPGVVRTTLEAMQMGDDVVVAVPGYHLGSELQQRAVDGGYDEQAEARLLHEIAWPSAGYRLFDVACPSGSCQGGPLRPMAESNFLAMRRTLFDDLGGYDPRFSDQGGGYCNLDLYVRVLEHTGSRLLVLAGEGTFHQFHGGVTTGGVRGEAREALMESTRAQYEWIRQRPWSHPTEAGQVFGRLPAECLRFLSPPAAPAQSSPTPLGATLRTA